MTHSVPSIVRFVFSWLHFSFSFATALQLLALLLQARRVAYKIFRPPSSKAASLGVTTLLLSLSTVCFVLCFERSMESLAALLCCMCVDLLWALLHVDMFAHPSLLVSIARACTYFLFVACPLLVPPPLYITLTYELLGFHIERSYLTRGMRVLIFWPAWLRADVVEWIRLVGHEVPLVRWLYLNSLSAAEVKKFNHFVASLPRAHSVKSRFMCTLLCLKANKIVLPLDLRKLLWWDYLGWATFLYATNPKSDALPVDEFFSTFRVSINLMRVDSPLWSLDRSMIDSVWVTEGKSGNLVQVTLLQKAVSRNAEGDYVILAQIPRKWLSYSAHMLQIVDISRAPVLWFVRYQRLPLFYEIFFQRHEFEAAHAHIRQMQHIAFAVCLSSPLRDLLQSARRDARQLTRFSGVSRRNISCDASTAVYRTFDGSCNNVAKPWFGQTGELIRRDTPPRYADGIGVPIVPVNARKISDAVFAVNGSDTFFPPGDRAPWSTLFVGIAQFFLHDLIHMAVPNASDPMPITSTMPFYRSSIYPGSGTSKSNPRQYTSSTTQWIDLSTVYGVTSEWNSKLRSHTGGRMLTGADGGLPLNTAGLPMESGFWPGAANPAQLFMCGDPRCNQDFFLCSMHDLFLREHNRLADELAAKNPSWDDEKIFQEARRRNTFIWQNIVLREFTLSFFEGQNSSFYRHLEDTVESGYDATLNPSVSVAWDLVYRFHVILRDFVARDASSNAPLGKVDFSMRNTYNATSYLSYGIESLVLGMAQTQANRVGLHMTDDMRNAKLPGSNQVAFDLAATSIQRSYDYGTGGLNDLRRAYGLPGYQAFEDITRDQETVARLKQVFAHPENIDVYTGALAEGTESVPLNHATVGPLITAMILRGALGYSLSDRFFYLHKNLPTSPTAEEWDLINNSTLANLITRNTKVKCISDFPLLYDPSTTSLPCYSKILKK